MKKKTVDPRIVCTAIASLAAIEIAAMCFGFNGTLRSIILVLIAGMAGVVIPTPDVFKR